MTTCPKCSFLKRIPGQYYSEDMPLCNCIGEDYWRSEATRQATHAQYWIQKFDALSEKIAVDSEAFIVFPDGSASASNAGGKCVTAGETAPYTINTAKTVAVSSDVYWQPIDTAPRGVKVQLLGKGNVATYGTYYGDKFWTHWCPLPKKAAT